jgi:hypothetical protein
MDLHGQTMQVSSLSWTGGGINDQGGSAGTLAITATADSTINPTNATLVSGVTINLLGGYRLTVTNAVQFKYSTGIGVSGTSSELDTFGGSFTQFAANSPGSVTLSGNGRWVEGDNGTTAYTFTSALRLQNTSGLFSLTKGSATAGNVLTFNNANLAGGAGVGNCTIINNASGNSGGQNAYKLGFCINDGGTVNSTAGNILNTGDVFSWAPAGTTSGSATISGGAGQSFGFFMTGGNLWADYIATGGVGAISFLLMSGTFSGGTINVGVWEGGGGVANGTSSQFVFATGVAIGNGVTSVSGYAVGGAVGPNQAARPFLVSGVAGATGTWVSNSPPTGNGHNWIIGSDVVNNVQEGWTIATGNW